LLGKVGGYRMTDHKGNEETGELGITYSNKITRRTQKN
jgi:hypothetical protein